MGLFGTELIEITPHIYCIRKPAQQSCCYIVQRKKDIVLIDSGSRTSAKDITKALAKLDWPMGRISKIFLTHWHADHSSGASEIQKLTGAAVFAHEQDSPFLIEEKKTEPNGTQTLATKIPVKRNFLIQLLLRIIPDLPLLSSLKSLLGVTLAKPISQLDRVTQIRKFVDTDFEIIETPGHTPGHLSFYYRPEKILFSGDALIVVDNHLKFYAKTENPDLEKAKESIEKLMTIQFKTVCPGHRQHMVVETAHRDELAQKLRQSDWYVSG